VTIALTWLSSWQVRAMRMGSDLTTGRVLSQDLAIESRGTVAAQGVQVWAEYSGKVSTDVKFTITTPSGTVVCMYACALTHKYAYCIVYDI
jgi:hypothetical protein